MANTEKFKRKDDSLDKQIGKNIADWMKQRDLTSKQLAAKLGIDESLLSKYLSGIRSVPNHVLKQMTRHLGVSIDALFGIKGEHSNENIATAAAVTGLSVDAVEALHDMTNSPSRKFFADGLLMDKELLNALVNYSFSYIPYEVQNSKYSLFPLKNTLRSGYQDLAFAALIRRLPLFAEKVKKLNADNFDKLAVEYLLRNGDINYAKKLANGYLDEVAYFVFDDEPEYEYSDYEPTEEEKYEAFVEEMREAEESGKQFKIDMDAIIEVLNKIQD